MNTNPKATLSLENGMKFYGEMFGDIKNIAGEVIFTTSMLGYQESFTDPSYAKQILVMTYPNIGNYGFNFDFEESEKILLNGIIVNEKCDNSNNSLSEMNFEAYLRQNKITGLCNVDTRALVLAIREYGNLRGAICLSETPAHEIKQMIDEFDDTNVIQEISTKNKYYISRKYKDITKIGLKIAVIDLGCKKSIINEFIKRESEIVVFPFDADFQEIRDEKPDLIFVSNGPGNPKNATKTIETVNALIGKINICGICMGHQIIGLALGGDTSKLKFGHRGINHPVKNLMNNKIYITSQNHNYFISNLPKKYIDITFQSINDGTIEGICSEKFMIKSVQFHPEASPGPLDVKFIFDDFQNI
ncbi:MAG: glutamine-hydrolyzing carbamoyl-phosphate synthase small subunit [Clostridiales bacterium]|jgi:carbamoyl-phosphate synthase small subunit|nr:glutamine-hydrolyzing carbamoyl-phosphate synthase small subunit [Clostridiales bacterium]